MFFNVTLINSDNKTLRYVAADRSSLFEMLEHAQESERIKAVIILDMANEPLTNLTVNFGDAGRKYTKIVESIDSYFNG